MTSTQWYRRLGDVPGVAHATPPGLDRRTLARHDARPRVEQFATYEGTIHTSLAWPSGAGTTGRSPAAEWTTASRAGESEAQRTWRQVMEALELPGTLSEYHFVLLHAYDVLWKARRADLWVVPEVERLCWLDVQLVESFPETVRSESANGPTYYGLPCFGILTDLYAREGFLREALDIALRAERFGHGLDVPELRTRIAALEAEHGA